MDITSKLSVVDGPIWTKFGKQMQNNMYAEAAGHAH